MKCPTAQIFMVYVPPSPPPRVPPFLRREIDLSKDNYFNSDGLERLKLDTAAAALCYSGISQTILNPSSYLCLVFQPALFFLLLFIYFLKLYYIYLLILKRRVSLIDF